MIFIISPPEHRCLVGAAEARHRLHQRVENRLEIDGRAADDLEHVGGGGLLLQRLAKSSVRAQFLEQPRVLDGDHRLLGEVAHQLDLLVGERPHFLTVNRDGADQFVFPEHRDDDEVRAPAKIGQSRRRPDRLPDRADWSEDPRSGPPDGFGQPWPRPLFGCGRNDICGRVGRIGRQAHCRAQRVVAVRPHNRLIVPKFAPQTRVAFSSIFWNTGSSSPGEAADDLKNLRGRGLLLQRLREVARPRLHFVEQPHIADGDHGLIGEGLQQCDLLVAERIALRCGAVTIAPMLSPSRNSGTLSMVRIVAMRRDISWPIGKFGRLRPAKVVHDAPACLANDRAPGHRIPG